MLVLTIKDDDSIRIGGQQIRISLSPCQKGEVEFWLWFDEQHEQEKITALQEKSCCKYAVDYPE